MSIRISKLGLQNKLKAIHAFLIEQGKEDMAEDISKTAASVGIGFDKELKPLEGDDGEWETFEREEMDIADMVMRSLGIDPKMIGKPIITENGIAIPVGMPVEEDENNSDYNHGVEFIVDTKNLERLRSYCRNLTSFRDPHLKDVVNNHVEIILYNWLADDGIQTIGDVMDAVAYIQKQIPEYVIAYMGPSFVRDLSLRDAEGLNIEFYADKNDSQPFFRLDVKHDINCAHQKSK